MPTDILDQLRTDELATQNAALAGAKAKADWANTFSSIPDEDRLRATRNLEAMRTQAIDRTMQLAAEVDSKAQESYYKKKEFEQWQKELPLRERMLESQIENRGATTRLKHEQDIMEQADTTGLSDGLAAMISSGVKPRTPEYRAGALRELAKYPAASDSFVRSIARQIGIPDEVTTEQIIAEGFKLRDELQANGVDARVRFGEKPSAVENDTPEQAAERVRLAAEARQAVEDAAAEKDIATKTTKIVSGLRRTLMKDGTVIKGMEEANAMFTKMLAEATDQPASQPQEKASLPVLTSKSEYDALPSGATYIRDGKTYRKP